MKKILFVLMGLTLTLVHATAQNAQKKKLEDNLSSIDELTKLLNTEYTQVPNLATVLPKSNFTMGEVMCITPYGDDNANKTAGQIETQFKAFFEKSKWVFGPDTYNRPEFGAIGKLTVTASGKTETTDYSSSGAMFKPGNIMEGIDANISVYQKKGEAKKFIFLMPVSSICTAVFEMEKQ